MGVVNRKRRCDGFGAIVALTAAPQDAVPFIAEHLKPTTRIEANRIERLIAELDSADFKVRDKAKGELLDNADQAAPAMDPPMRGSAGRPTPDRPAVPPS